MPNWTCCVSGCPNTAKEFSGFGFPSQEPDRVRFDSWVHFCRRRHPTRADQEWIPTRNHYVCEQHFEPSCIIRHFKKRDDEGNPVVLKRPLLTPDATPKMRDPNQPLRNRKPRTKRPRTEKKEKKQTEEAPQFEYQPLPLCEEDAVDVPPSADSCVALLQHDVMQGFQTMQEVPSGWCVRTDASTSAVQYLKLETAVITDAFSIFANVSAVLEATLELKVFVNGRILSPTVYPPFSPVTPSALSMILQVLNSLQLCTGFEVGPFHAVNQALCDRYTTITGERFRHRACELVLKKSNVRLHDRCNTCNRAYVRAAGTERKIQHRGGTVPPRTNDKSLSREALIAKLHQLRKERKNLREFYRTSKKRAYKSLGSLGGDEKESSEESSETDQEDAKEEAKAPIARSKQSSVSLVFSSRGKNRKCSLIYW